MTWLTSQLHLQNLLPGKTHFCDSNLQAFVVSSQGLAFCHPSAISGKVCLHSTDFCLSFRTHLRGHQLLKSCLPFSFQTVLCVAEKKKRKIAVWMIACSIATFRRSRVTTNEREYFSLYLLTWISLKISTLVFPPFIFFCSAY